MKNRIILFVGIALLSATQASLMSATAPKPGSLEAAQATTATIQAMRAAREARDRETIATELAEVNRAKQLSLQPGLLAQLAPDATAGISTETLPPLQLPALKGSRPPSAASTKPDLLMEYSQQVLATGGNRAPVSSPLSASTDGTPAGMRRVASLCSPTFMSPTQSEVQSVPSSSPSTEGISSPSSRSKSKLAPLDGRASASSRQSRHAIASNPLDKSALAAMTLAKLGENATVAVSEKTTDSSPRDLEAYNDDAEPVTFLLASYVNPASTDAVDRSHRSPVPTRKESLLHPSPQKPASSVENSPEKVLPPSIRSNISDTARGRLSFAGKSDASSLLGANTASKDSEPVLAALVSSPPHPFRRPSRHDTKLTPISGPVPAPAPSSLLAGIGRAPTWTTEDSAAGSLAAEDASASSGTGMLAPNPSPMSTPSPEQLAMRAAKKEAALEEHKKLKALKLQAVARQKKALARQLEAAAVVEDDEEEESTTTDTCILCLGTMQPFEELHYWHTAAGAGMHRVHRACYKDKPIPTQCPICRVNDPRTSTDSPAHALHLLLASSANKGKESAARDIRMLRLTGASVSSNTLLAHIQKGDVVMVEQALTACSLDDDILSQALFRAIKCSRKVTDDRFVEIAKLLLEWGASTAVIDGSGLTVFMVAARFSSPQMLVMLFSRHTTADLLATALNQTCSSYGYTALMYAAKYSTDTDVAKALIDAGADCRLAIKKQSHDELLTALGLARQRKDAYGPTMVGYLEEVLGVSPTRSSASRTPSSAKQ